MMLPKLLVLVLVLVLLMLMLMMLLLLRRLRLRRWRQRRHWRLLWLLIPMVMLRCVRCLLRYLWPRWRVLISL
jgi:hypothetical protein